jgi:hypothetical protein
VARSAARAKRHERATTVPRSEFNKRLIESRKTVTLRRNCHMECVSKVDTLFIKGDRARQRVWGLTVMVCPPTNARNASAMTAGGRL